MNITIHQSIHIHMIKIGSIMNSSVLQIGSTGSIQAHADVHNSGDFTEAAEPVPHIVDENKEPVIILQELKD